MSSSTTNSNVGVVGTHYLRWFFAALLVVLGAVAGCNFVIDPYGLAGRNLLRIDQDGLSRLRNDRLTELAGFNRAPHNIVILGDSRGQALKEQFFADYGLSVSNLAYGGGTVFESIDTFDFAQQRARLQAVIFVLPFNSWSESDRGNLVDSAVTLIEHPAMYYFNAGIFQAAISNLWAVASGGGRRSQAPPMSSDAFWRYQIDYAARGFYARWQEPQRLRAKFLDMMRECRGRGIRVLLVVPPTHVELQAEVAHFGLENQHLQYLQLLNSQAETLDFDIPDETTRNRALFVDPFHSIPAVNRALVRTIVEALRRAPVNQGPAG